MKCMLLVFFKILQKEDNSFDITFTHTFSHTRTCSCTTQFQKSWDSVVLPQASNSPCRGYLQKNNAVYQLEH